METRLHSLFGIIYRTDRKNSSYCGIELSKLQRNIDKSLDSLLPRFSFSLPLCIDAKKVMHMYYINHSKVFVFFIYRLRAHGRPSVARDLKIPTVLAQLWATVFK